LIGHGEVTKRPAMIQPVDWTPMTLQMLCEVRNSSKRYL